MRTSLLSFLTLLLLDAALAIRASPMGIVHTITVEDMVNGDDDYNDIVIQLTAWTKRN